MVKQITPTCSGRCQFFRTLKWFVTTPQFPATVQNATMNIQPNKSQPHCHRYGGSACFICAIGGRILYWVSLIVYILLINQEQSSKLNTFMILQTGQDMKSNILMAFMDIKRYINKLLLLLLLLSTSHQVLINQVIANQLGNC